MAHGFKTVVSYLRQTAFSFLGKSSTTTNPGFEIPTDSVPVFFKGYLLAEYKLTGVSRMDSMMILEVNLMKEKGTSNHEYISVRVLAPDETTFCVAIERGRGAPLEDIQADAGNASNSSPCLPSTSTTLSTVESLDTLLPQYKANDVISSFHH